MADDTVAALLEREHQAIDRRCEQFIAEPVPQASTVAGLQEAITLLRRHVYLEEEYLFPALREDGLLPPVLVMLREHGQIWRTLDLLEDQLRAEPDAGRARDTCRRLVVELLHHNLKEERILYPRADHALAASRAAELIEFLTGAAQLPAGWTCAKFQV